LTSPSALGAFNDSKTGGGFGVSASAPLFAKKLDVSLKGVYGTGIGRFGSAQLADVTARPDGTLATIHNAQWLGKLEWHPTRRSTSMDTLAANMPPEQPTADTPR